MRMYLIIFTNLLEIFLTEKLVSSESTTELIPTQSTSARILSNKLSATESTVMTESSTVGNLSNIFSTEVLSTDIFTVEHASTDIILSGNATTEIILPDQTTQSIFLQPTKVSFSCKFSYDFDWLIIGRIYMCTVLGNLTITSESTTVTSVTGEHRIFKNNDKIFALWFLDKEMHFLPVGITNFFRHIAGMVINRCQLKQLRQSDMAPLYKIRELYLIENDLEVLDGNLFEFNKRLELLWLDGNKIKRIDGNVFDGLEKLQYLNFREKSCTLKKVKYDPQGVKKVMKEMKRRCAKN